MTPEYEYLVNVFEELSLTMTNFLAVVKEAPKSYCGKVYEQSVDTENL